MVLFNPDGTGTGLLFAQWRRKAPSAPIQAYAVLLDEKRAATVYFRQLWARAFPLRQPLPKEPIAGRDGIGTDAFWDVFA